MFSLEDGAHVAGLPALVPSDSFIEWQDEGVAWASVQACMETFFAGDLSVMKWCTESESTTRCLGMPPHFLHPEAVFIYATIDLVNLNRVAMYMIVTRKPTDDNPHWCISNVNADRVHATALLKVGHSDLFEYNPPNRRVDLRSLLNTKNVVRGVMLHTSRLDEQLTYDDMRERTLETLYHVRAIMTGYRTGWTPSKKRRMESPPVPPDELAKLRKSYQSASNALLRNTEELALAEKSLREVKAEYGAKVQEVDALRAELTSCKKAWKADEETFVSRMMTQSTETEKARESAYSWRTESGKWKEQVVKLKGDVRTLTSELDREREANKKNQMAHEATRDKTQKRIAELKSEVARLEKIHLTQSVEMRRLKTNDQSDKIKALRIEMDELRRKHDTVIKAHRTEMAKLKQQMYAERRVSTSPPAPAPAPAPSPTPVVNASVAAESDVMFIGHVLDKPTSKDIAVHAQTLNPGPEAMLVAITLPNKKGVARTTYSEETVYGIVDRKSRAMNVGASRAVGARIAVAFEGFDDSDIPKVGVAKRTVEWCEGVAVCLKGPNKYGVLFSDGEYVVCQLSDALYCSQPEPNQTMQWKYQ